MKRKILEIFGKVLTFSKGKKKVIGIFDDGKPFLFLKRFLKGWENIIYDGPLKKIVEYFKTHGSQIIHLFIGFSTI